MDETDKNLIKSFKEGDPEILQVIYSDYKEKILQFFFNKFNFTPFEAMDLLQETFLRAFSPKCRLSFRGEASVLSYILGIANNIGKDYLKAIKKKQSLTKALSQEKPYLTTQSFDESFEKHKIKEAIDEVLLTLSDEEREMIIQYYVQRYTLCDLSKRFNLTIWGVRMSLQKMKEKLLPLASSKDLHEITFVASFKDLHQNGKHQKDVFHLRLAFFWVANLYNLS